MSGAPSISTPSSEPSAVQRQLLAHTDKMWKAEEANATRIATKANLVTAGITATLGFKLFATKESISSVLASPLWVEIVTFTLTTLAVASLLQSLRLALDIKVYLRRAMSRIPILSRFPPLSRLAPFKGQKPRDYTASMLLIFPTQYLTASQTLTEADVVAQFTAATYGAAVKLHERNNHRKRRIEAAERWFLAGLLLVICCLVLFVYSAVQYGKTDHPNGPKSGAGGSSQQP